MLHACRGVLVCRMCSVGVCGACMLRCVVCAHVCVLSTLYSLTLPPTCLPSPLLSYPVNLVSLLLRPTPHTCLSAMGMVPVHIHVCGHSVPVVYGRGVLVPG